MSQMKAYLADIETAADDLIRKETGINRFFGDYEWHNGIAGAYVSAIVETASGFFCVQFWKRRNLVQLHKESQPGIFTPICSITI
jgi:hypothetical protein